MEATTVHLLHCAIMLAKLSAAGLLFILTAVLFYIVSLGVCATVGALVAWFLEP